MIMFFSIPPYQLMAVSQAEQKYINRLETRLSIYLQEFYTNEGLTDQYLSLSGIGNAAPSSSSSSSSSSAQFSSPHGLLSASLPIPVRKKARGSDSTKIPRRNEKEGEGEAMEDGTTSGNKALSSSTSVLSENGNGKEKKKRSISEAWHRLKIHRVLVDHLLREGCFESATKYVEMFDIKVA